MTESPPQWIEPEREDEARLALDLIPAASKPSRLWFFVHGLNSNRRGQKALHFARHVTRRGEAFASLDFTGHGDSEGDLQGLCLSRNLRDLDRGLRFAGRHAGPFSAVHLVGSSMGGLTALWYSANNPDRVAANLVIAPAFEMAGRLLLALGPSKAGKWRRDGEARLETEYADFNLSYDFVRDEARYPTGKLLKALKTATLILHGSRDDTVPCQLSRNFAMRLPIVKLVVIEGGDHRLTDHKERLFEEMWKFVGPAGRNAY